MKPSILRWAIGCVFFAASGALLWGAEPFAIVVVDDETGRGVPLAELRTVGGVVYFTDSNGVVAFDEPGLMSRHVYLRVSSSGYELPRGGFPGGGRTFAAEPGGTAVVELRRVDPAERLYRVTGEGIYRDSILVGAPVPISHPLLNAEVVGQDSAQAVVHGGRIYWFWGDTTRLSAHLGTFRTTGATSRLPEQGGLPPSVGVDLDYLVGATGFARDMCPAEEIPGPGAVWVDGLVDVPDQSGRRRLVAAYQRLEVLGQPLERGLVMFDEEVGHFTKLMELPADAPLWLRGHPARVELRGQEYFYFSFAGPGLIRVPAELSSLCDPSAYQAFTPLAPGAGPGSRDLERGPDGDLRWGWKAATALVSPRLQEELIEDGLMTEAEGILQLRDVRTGAPVLAHAGSMSFNEYRGRWILIFQESRGLVDNGNVWFAEADTPIGPWVYARRVAGFERQTFYNPVHHAFFDEDGGRTIYFEGTYSKAFSRSLEPTPRYNYNQLMYRLSLDDPRLMLPVPVYSLGEEGRLATGRAVAAEDLWAEVRDIRFFACEQARKGLIPIWATKEGRLGPKRAVGEGAPVFYALPAVRSEPDRHLLAGRWRCHVTRPVVQDTPFALELEIEGGRLAGRVDDAEIGSGQIVGERGTAQLARDGDVLTLRMEVERGRLKGSWALESAGLEGSFVGERVVDDEDQSAAVVPLWEYRRPNGTRFYTTEGDLAGASAARSPHPVCSVWRSPFRRPWLDLVASPGKSAP